MWNDLNFNQMQISKWVFSGFSKILKLQSKLVGDFTKSKRLSLWFRRLWGLLWNGWLILESEKICIVVTVSLLLTILDSWKTYYSTWRKTLRKGIDYLNSNSFIFKNFLWIQS